MNLVIYYLQLCRSPVRLSLTEWAALPQEHKDALEEAWQAARKLETLEAMVFSPDGAMIQLSEYDGGEALRGAFRARNVAAFQALDAAGVELMEATEATPEGAEGENDAPVPISAN